MNKKKSDLTNIYLEFDREQWISLHNSKPAIPTVDEITKFKNINEGISATEINQVYLHIVSLLNLYINSDLSHRESLYKFLKKTDTKKTPFIISIAGSVSAGKSTTSKIIQALLSFSGINRKVEIVGTDGFLFPNHILKSKGLMRKKGFPVSYDVHGFVKFVSDLKSGKNNINIPVYSHIIYDIIPNDYKTIDKADVVIIEGLNVLQSGMNYPHTDYNVFVSDFVDFSIYLDADEDLLESWYIDRFLKLCEDALSDPGSYFNNYTNLSKEEAKNFARKVWSEINLVNLKENILPTRERAHLIIKKGDNHLVENIKLRL